MVNTKPPYAITPARPANKATTAITTATATSPSTSSKSLPSLTRSLSSIINRIKESNNKNGNNLTKAPLSVLDTNHIHLRDFSKSKGMKPSTFKDAIHPKGSDRKINIGFVDPTFTTAAYHDSFYVFYTLYENIPTGKNVTTSLNLLTSKVASQTRESSYSAFAMLYLSKNIKSLIPKSSIVVLTDSDVDADNIFTMTRSNKYDVLIMGHQEYVTQQEYDNLRQFVADGGRMIILDSNIFYAEVKYNKNTQTITLLKGHGWAFNGRSAWKSVAEGWKDETSQWVGSNYLCYQCGIIFDNDPFEYRHHEEQYITNPKV